MKKNKRMKYSEKIREWASKEISKQYVLSYEDEIKIKDLLLWHKVISVTNGDTLLLDNGTELEIIPNEGCGGCGNGWYEITDINGCDNAITDVKFDNAGNHYKDIYQIFVYSENKKMKLLQVEGSDNGFYGSGYTINVKIREREEIQEEAERE